MNWSDFLLGSFLLEVAGAGVDRQLAMGEVTGIIVDLEGVDIPRVVAVDRLGRLDGELDVLIGYPGNLCVAMTMLVVCLGSGVGAPKKKSDHLAGLAP